MNTTNKRWWDLPAALFLLGALLSAAVRLHATNWTTDLSRMEFNVILGAVFGFALGISKFRGRWTFLMGLVYSLFFVPWQLGLMIPGVEWNERLSLLYARLWYATADFLANKPVRDSILFLTTMMILYWFASLLSSYQLVRRANPWLPLLSLGGMIIVIEYTMEMYRYARIVGATYSFIFLVFTLLLLGRIYYLRSRREWEERGGTVEMEVGYDLGRGVALTAVILALVAWNTPRVVNFFDSENPTRERVSRSWQVFRDRISNAANTLRSPSPMVVEGYGSNMFLGTGGNQGEAVMFTVKSQYGRNASGRFYWKARSYDRYRAGQWTTTIADTQEIGPTKPPVEYPDWLLRRQIQLTFHSRISLLKTLYYSGEPTNINRDAKAVVSIAEDGTADFNAIILEPPLKGGETYTVRVSVAQPSIMRMVESGEDYPEWILERYLELPANFSPRIVDLANQIAGEEETPYAKAAAITQYLRRTITYSESIPEPPRGRDPIEWFLFDHRSGFCNYYATAEVLMLRSLGVPARMAVGYAEGIWDPETEVYVVAGRDSHAWPEVYFPTLGWIAFEPTVSQPVVEFPTGERPDLPLMPAEPSAFMEPTFDPLSIVGDQEPFDPSQLERPIQNPFSFVRPWMVILFLVLVGLAVVSFLEWRRRRIEDLPLPSFLEKKLDEHGFRIPAWLRMWSRRALRTPMENMFSQIAMMLRIWGQRVEPAQTPAEQVALLVNIVPGIKKQAIVLLEEYQRAMYSQYPANLIRARQAVAELRSTGYRTWVLRLIGLET